MKFRFTLQNRALLTMSNPKIFKNILLTSMILLKGLIQNVTKRLGRILIYFVFIRVIMML